MACLVERQREAIQKEQDEIYKSKYMKDVLKLIGEAKEEETAPVVIAKINQLHQKYFHKAYSFEALKRNYNQMLLEKAEAIEEQINQSETPLKRAILLARAGNYIDFGAMGSVDDQKLEVLLNEGKNETLEAKTYAQFESELTKAQSLVYLTDNCGEIVLDKLLIKQLQKYNPSLNVTMIVRGKPVLNDATIEDAQMVGLTKLVKVIPNGTEIAGTDLKSISAEARSAILSADLLLSKGQGNFETLHGCGLNIYYMFLCKCDWFVKRFQLKPLQGVWINERDAQIQ